jgi:hypothetical protein
MSKKSARGVLHTDQLRILASPVRIDIVGAFQAYGSMPIRELADKLARPADGLYHHVRQLQEAGILQVAKTARRGKRDESVFALTAERFGHTSKPKSPVQKQAVVEAAAAALRLTNREFCRAVLANESSQTKRTGKVPFAKTKLSRQRSWLTNQDLKSLHNLLNQIESFLQARMRRKQGRPFAVTLAVVPLPKGKRG